MALKRAVRSDNQERFKFEKQGDTIKGYYIQTTEVAIDGKLVKKHVFNTTKGLVSVLGQADMYQQLVDNNCDRAYVEITYTGETKKIKGGRTMKLYVVDYDLNNKWEGEVAESGTGDDGDEVGLGEDEQAFDEIPPTPATKATAKLPSPDRQAATQRLFNGGKKMA